MSFVISMMDLPVPPSPENSPAWLSGTRFGMAHLRSGMGSRSQLDMLSQGILFAAGLGVDGAQIGASKHTSANLLALR